jgi:hypothetical protein
MSVLAILETAMDLAFGATRKGISKESLTYETKFDGIRDCSSRLK